jgi:predicted HAD superfamily phosphohydrolase YqeG
MVGDQIFTDVLGARRAGLRVVLVHPIELKSRPLLALRYALETPFRLMSSRQFAV